MRFWAKQVNMSVSCHVYHRRLTCLWGGATAEQLAVFLVVMAGSEDGGALGGQTKKSPRNRWCAASHSLAVFAGRHHEHWMWLGLGADSRRSRKDSPTIPPFSQ